MEFNIMTIAWIISKIKDSDYLFSKHADDERLDDNLMVVEIEEAIVNGMILESYPSDKRGSSCLVVGFTNLGKPIHIVCGKSASVLIIITVYIPTPPKFINPYQRSEK
jgi:hypothetical protein